VSKIILIAGPTASGKSALALELAEKLGVDPGKLKEAAAQALAEGFALGSYRFLTYKSDGEASKLTRVTVMGGAGAATRAGLDRGVAVAAAVAWARDMVNEPSGAKSPAEFAAAARKLLTGRGVTVTVGELQAIDHEIFTFALNTLLDERPFRDAVYSLVARNRYRIFGTYQTCFVPDAAMRARVME